MATYDLTNISIDHKRSEETVCIEANLRDTTTGKIVALVCNAGRGGATMIHVDPTIDLSHDEIAADLIAQYGEYGIETLVERAEFMSRVARKRKAIYLLPGDDDPFETGLVREMNGDRAGSIALIRVKHPDALVFDKRALDFVPVSQVS